MLKLSDLALRPDIQIGPMLVSPSRRLVEGPGGHAHVEPLIMQVFLMLLDAGGRVVTRTELFDQCWGGVIVGDDSLNRAIAKVRRTTSHIAPGLLEIETIPRTGYRLTGEILQLLDKSAAADRTAVEPQGLSRRTLIAGGATAAVAVGAGGYWIIRSREDRDFDELMERGEVGLDSNDPADDGTDYFRRAAAMRPDDAAAQGKFAFAQAVHNENGGPGGLGSLSRNAERAAATALALDPNQSYAQLARIVIQAGTLDLAGTESRLRRVLAADPDNVHAMKLLWNMLQCVGRSREALVLVERALQVRPLAPANHYPRAQLLWINGRTAEADRVIDRALQNWPAHRWVRFARFTIFAFTNRARAALAMIERPETAPQHYTPEAISLWRIALTALDQPTSANIAAARQAHLEAVKTNLQLTSQAAQVMSALGDVDAAFEVTNAFFAVGKSNAAAASSSLAKSTAWRFAPWLFIPPTAAMRRDPRFQALVDEIGLSSYWRTHRIRPDYLA